MNDGAVQKHPFNNYAYYNNREISWLAFNERVLEEAEDETNPLLERLKFLAIFSSNLDEFFMVRVAGLQDQVRAGFNKPENKAGLTPKEQLNQIALITKELVSRQMKIYKELIEKQLPMHGISLVKYADLSIPQKQELQKLFEEEIFPVLTPIAVDTYRPFPILLSKTMNILVMIEDSQDANTEQNKIAIVQVPSVLKRFIQVSTEDGSFVAVLLEDVIVEHISNLFHGYHVKHANPFRITRNADLTIHEEGARDLLIEIEKELKKRKWGAVSRLEVKVSEIKPKLLNFLLDELEIMPEDVYKLDGPLDVTFLFSFIKSFEGKYINLFYEPFIPQPPLDISSDEEIFAKVQKQDLFFHHPYESFQPIIDFIEKAAEDPSVLAIKQTLYRVSGNSPVILALKRAAENGKQVTVLVELKARFDEENNVQWAKELEKAGCLVIYGMHNLKTHSKITLVVRRRNNRIEQYVHLGTGNYNDQTARTYTDMGIITADKNIGSDATQFFNFLSGYTDKPNYDKLVVSPYDIRDKFISLIDEEIECHQAFHNGHIKLKMNSLTDKDLILKLYEASSVGVKVDLIVRGTCCLLPKIPGVSENITVSSIVGRFLEHSRIYWFHRNGDSKLYLSSADMMTRNMVKRVEILFPVLSPPIKKRVMEILDLELRDTVKARFQDQSGKYHYKDKTKCKLDSQQILLERSLKYIPEE
ncbi:RNA degradosome polyphosphate kinase [Psychrobacillus psychrodurans]|uniref:RNA degradosome polyphosphate kinase n=1 Tax=Psychrobacillus psychrodurans TaxID=126157 RepID=UPI0008E30A6B|nr:RNA degradosome polyphosphate kinase [Psychrobacillus psychrodurans]MCZ8539984.1 RNA degradosome polyphosphate kinase [Psychrobacillus psychrodurans]SFM52827.1 polyphosphate kinase [Psychrobacillus psychrodurans]